MSASNYEVRTNGEKYLLKVFSHGQKEIEISMYKYLNDYVSVPSLFYYNRDNEIIPYCYAILEFIDGDTLKKHILKEKAYSKEIAFLRGKSLKQIHQKKYHYHGILDNQMMVNQREKGTKEFILSLLDGVSGKNLVNIKSLVKDFCENNTCMFDEIDKTSVLSHGDLNYNNILLAKDKMFFIDFEYAMSESIYLDIGKFFRKKDPFIENLVTEEIKQAFASGYGNLPNNWYILARVKDMASMIGLANRESFPPKWIEEIEEEIRETISLIK